MGLTWTGLLHCRAMVVWCTIRRQFVGWRSWSWELLDGGCVRPLHSRSFRSSFLCSRWRTRHLGRFWENEPPKSSWKIRMVTKEFEKWPISDKLRSYESLSRVRTKHSVICCCGFLADVELLRYKPSIVTASALLTASHELFPVQFQCFRTAIFACSYVNKVRPFASLSWKRYHIATQQRFRLQEELTECYGLMQGVATERYESDLLDDGNVSFGEEDMPMNVLDQQFSCSCNTYIGNSCGDTTTTNCMAMSSSSSSWSSTTSTNRHLKRRKNCLWSKCQLQQSFQQLIRFSSFITSYSSWSRMKLWICCPFRESD